MAFADLQERCVIYCSSSVLNLVVNNSVYDELQRIPQNRFCCVGMALTDVQAVSTIQLRFQRDLIT